jgi:hypothetical protein
MDGVQDRISDKVPVFPLHRINGPIQGRHIAGLLRYEHRRGLDLLGDPQGTFLEAQEILRSGLAATHEVLRLQRIDTDLIPVLAQSYHGFV